MFRSLILLSIVACGCVSGSHTISTDPVQQDLDYPVGSFSLTERSDRTVTDKDLRGTV